MGKERVIAVIRGCNQNLSQLRIEYKQNLMAAFAKEKELKITVSSVIYQSSWVIGQWEKLIEKANKARCGILVAELSDLTSNRNIYEYYKELCKGKIYICEIEKSREKGSYEQKLDFYFKIAEVNRAKKQQISNDVIRCQGFSDEEVSAITQSMRAGFTFEEARDGIYAVRNKGTYYNGV
jgi:hypothetical protein